MEPHLWPILPRVSESSLRLAFLAGIAMLAGCDQPSAAAPAAKKPEDGAAPANAAEVRTAEAETTAPPAAAATAEDGGAKKPASEAAEGDDSSAGLKAMLKKVRERGRQRTGTYLEQMNGALAEADVSGAEAALKAAISQGSLTQKQIDEARGRIDGELSRQQAAQVAQAKAKAEAQQRAAADREMAAAGNTPGKGAAGAGAAEPKFVQIEFQKSHFQSVRVFNVNGSGGRERFPTELSPGSCQFASKEVAEDDARWGMEVQVFPENGRVAGTYGFQVVMQEVTNYKAFSRSSTTTPERVSGTFTIPPGADAVYLSWDHYSKRFEVQSFK
jgi:hypothetical protein